MIQIREAVADDALYIIDFQQKMALETESLALDYHTLTKGVHAVFEDPAKGKYFVATEGTKVVGSLLITYEWSDWRCGQVVWIQSVYIIPEGRGKGVFKLMYHHIQTLVTANPGYRGIRLYVDKTNTRAQHVYERLGMNGHHYQMYEWMLGS
ncbi:MAG: GNAT family N-acetyltransferase [Cyclobacteriaceae bacterium]|nr:GNAT family N-acetyltransferase [Cyclobacteriaceae bacterium]